MSLLSYIHPQTVYRTSSPYNQDIHVLRRYGKNILLVNGIEQSGPYTTKLWEQGIMTLIPLVKRTTKNILVLGVGGGTLFPILHTYFPDAKITGVDIDTEILRIYKTYFMDEKMNYVSFVCNDAKAFVHNSVSAREKYDLIIIDLYVANDVPDFVTDCTFHTSVKNMLTSNAPVVFNYFSYHNQPKKKKILFEKLKKIYNLVLYKEILHNIFYYCS